MNEKSVQSAKIQPTQGPGANPYIDTAYYALNSKPAFELLDFDGLIRIR